MHPMLPRTYGPKFSSYPCWLQPKFNGIRCLYSQGVFQSREGHLFSNNVLRHLWDELDKHRTILGGLVLDGELYVHGWRLQRINSAIAVKRNAPTEDSPFIEYHVFDCAIPGQEKADFSTRFLFNAPLQQLANQPLSFVKFAETRMGACKFDVESYFEDAVLRGYEGIMLRPEGPYELGQTSHGTDKRSKYLWKYKSWSDGEYMCINTIAGAGKASIGIGALVLIDDRTGQQFHCGTGLTDEERMTLQPIGHKVKIRYPYTSQDGIPQCPSFLCVL